MTRVLHGYFRSSAAYRVRIALNLKGLDYEPVSVHLRKGEQRAEGFLALNPQGMVPALVDGEAVIDESLEVMMWALKRNDPEGWLSRKDDALIAENDGPFKHHLDRYKYAARYEDADAEEHRAAGFEFLQKLEVRFENGASILRRAERPVSKDKELGLLRMKGFG